MQFTITKKQFGNHLLYGLADCASKTTVSIIPGCGASLNNFIVDTGSKTVEVINGYKSGDDLQENVAKNFKGVVLSPFANRVNKATYNFNNSNYVLDKVWKDKDYAIHGYLYCQSFDVLNETVNDEEATLVLKHKYDGSLPGFPFTYETIVIYSLQKNNLLTCQTTIQNTGTLPMPLSFGWHPLFFNEVNINNVELSFPADYQIGVDEEYIPNGEKKPYDTFNNARKIEETFFDYCYKLNEGALKQFSELKSDLKKVKLTEPFNRIQIELEIETGPGKFKYLQIYIPPQRNTIALEPMSSWPDAFNNQQDLISLQPNEIVEMNYGIKVSTF